MVNVLTASGFALLLHARRIGKGKWVAKCPAHRDRHPSLSIAVGKNFPIVLSCMSHGCTGDAIIAAAGVRWRDFFDAAPSPAALREAAERRKREEAQEKAERRRRGRLIDQARRWDEEGHRLGNALAKTPDDEKLGRRFHWALDRRRAAQAEMRTALVAGGFKQILIPGEYE